MLTVARRLAAARPRRPCSSCRSPRRSARSTDRRIRSRTGHAAILAQAGIDLVTLTNASGRQPVSYLQMDPDLMAIARDRAEVMAANDVMSHTEPDGRKVFDRINDARIYLVRRRRDPRLEQLSDRVLGRRGDPRLDGLARPPRDHGLDRLQLRRLRGGGLGDRQRYYAGVFVKEPDETGAVAEVRHDLEAIGRSPRHARHDPLVRRRHAGSRS